MEAKDTCFCEESLIDKTFLVLEPENLMVNSVKSSLVRKYTWNSW